MSIYATGTTKAYRAKVVLSNGQTRIHIYNIYAQHPMGCYDWGPWKKRDAINRYELVEIEGIDRDGNPASVIVPEWVLRHFLAAIDNGELDYDMTAELIGEGPAREELKDLIRTRRKSRV